MKFKPFVGSDIVDDNAVIQSNLEHIISRIPSCFDITRKEVDRTRVGDTSIMPSWESYCGGVANESLQI